MPNKKKFLRAVNNNYSKLGHRRKSKQKYRRAKGEDNKMRLKIKGHPRNVSIGFRTKKQERDIINGLKPVLVKNLNELKNIKKGEIAIIAKVGDKKRIQIMDYAEKNKILIANLKIDKRKEKIKESQKKRKELKEKRNKKKLEKEKKKVKKEKIEKKPLEKKTDEKSQDGKKENKDSEKTETKQKEKKKEIKSNNYGRGN